MKQNDAKGDRPLLYHFAPFLFYCINQLVLLGSDFGLLPGSGPIGIAVQDIVDGGRIYNTVLPVSVSHSIVRVNVTCTVGELKPNRIGWECLDVHRPSVRIRNLKFLTIRDLVRLLNV